MSAPINDVEPAFPVPSVTLKDKDGTECVALGKSGMSLRDWFAGQAPEMPEWYRRIESINGKDAQPGMMIGFYDTLVYEPHLKSVARWSYEYADAMLKARENKE